MGKLVSIETFERFETLWNANRIDLRSLTFILDTGQLYTHGIFLNSVVYGEEASGAVPVTIAGVTKTLALSSHNHDATYYKKTENINLGTYKLVSGEKELIYLNNAKIYVGDTTLPIQIQSNAALKSYRDLHEYTMLDTGNFSIENKTTTNYTLSNVATIKYGSNSFQLDYIKRLNTSSTFDTLSAYTSAGTTLVNGTLYGFMTFYTDGTTLNPSWAQLRIDISNKTLEIRTSASTNWVGFPTGSYKNIKVNNTDYALLTSENSLPTIYAPASAGTGFLKGSTDGNGNITWTWDNSTYNNYSLPTATDSLLGGVKVGTTLESATGYTAVHIKDGVIYYKNYTATPILGGSTAISNATSDTSDPYLNIIENGAKSGGIQIKGSGGTTVAAKDGVLTITSISLGTGATDAAKGDHDHDLNLATDSGTSTIDLSSNTVYKLTAGGKTLIFKTPSDSINVTSALYVGASNGEGNAQVGTTPYLIFKEGTSFSRYKLEGAGGIIVSSDTNGNILFTGTTYSVFSAATSSAAGANGLVPAPAQNQLGSSNYYLRADGTWQALGSAAFISADTTLTLSREAGNLTKDTWSDAGIFPNTVSDGTYAVKFTVDGTIYSGLFSYKSGDTLTEEINLHAAGTSTRRLYARTNGSKFLIVTDADTFSMAATTFYFRKLL